MHAHDLAECPKHHLMAQAAALELLLCIEPHCPARLAAVQGGTGKEAEIAYRVLLR